MDLDEPAELHRSERANASVTNRGRDLARALDLHERACQAGNAGGCGSLGITDELLGYPGKCVTLITREDRMGPVQGRG
jgi:hypothetical protein